MLDLSFVQECQEDVIESVRDSLDTMYIKNRTIMECVMNSNNDEEFSDMTCFLEAAGIGVGSSKELNVFSFKNDHIIKSIKRFNKAYNELDFSDTTFEADKKEQERGNLNSRLRVSSELVKQAKEKFIKDNSNFMKGFEELEKQFDCNFTLYTSPRAGTGTAILKFPAGQNNINKITISKRDGFQLDGLPIILNINIEQIMEIVPPDRKLFGATFVGIILHEIYHNIVHCIDLRNKNLHAIIKSTFNGITEGTNDTTIRTKVNTLIDKFKSAFSIRDRDFNEERSRNRFVVLAHIKDNANAMSQFENDIKNNSDETNSEKELDEYIRKLNSVKNTVSFRKAAKLITVACAILLAGIGFVFGSTLAAATGVVYLAIMALSLLMKKVRSLFSVSVGVQEEYFCDLFAAMYKLPIHLTSYNRQIKLNKMHQAKVKQIRDKTNKISDAVNDPHPTTFDRETVSYQTAKQILASGKPLKKEIKNYLKYIVDLHEGIDTLDAPHTRRQAKKLDPESAKDLQKTLNDFVNKSGVTVTESFLVEDGEEDGS